MLPAGLRRLPALGPFIVLRTQGEGRGVRPQVTCRRTRNDKSAHDAAPVRRCRTTLVFHTLFNGGREHGGGMRLLAGTLIGFFLLAAGVGGKEEKNCGRTTPAATGLPWF